MGIILLPVIRIKAVALILKFCLFSICALNK